MGIVSQIHKVYRNTEVESPMMATTEAVPTVIYVVDLSADYVT